MKGWFVDDLFLSIEIIQISAESRKHQQVLIILKYENQCLNAVCFLNVSWILLIIVWLYFIKQYYPVSNSFGPQKIIIQNDN